MKRSIIIAIGCGLFLIGCGKSDPTPPVQTQTDQSADQSKNLIIGQIFPTNTGDWLPTDEVKGGWIPTQEEIRAIEPAILDYIKAEKPDIYAKIDLYRCQYFGIYADGRKRIYCNFFQYSENDKDWRTKPIDVCDGGDAYFHLSYDVVDKKCLNLFVNGNA